MYIRNARYKSIVRKRGGLINIGKLNKRITFLENAWRKDEIGQDIQEWALYKTVWATVKVVRGNEYYEAQKIRPELTYKIFTRYHPGISPDMIIKYNNQILEIKSVINVDEAGYMLEIQCIERIEKGEIESARSRT